MWGMEYVNERKRRAVKVSLMSLYACGFLVLLVFSFIALPKDIVGLGWFYALAFGGGAITTCGILKPQQTATVLFIIAQTITFRRDLDAEANIITTTILFVPIILGSFFSSLLSMVFIAFS